MLRLIGIVVTIGLADSMNPTTIAPALYLSAVEHPRERVMQFTLGVFGVYFLGGLVIALGPGQLLLSLIPHPSHLALAVIEVIAGAVMIVIGVVLWRHRNRLAERMRPPSAKRASSSVVLGATITAVELPTAFPYFAAIAAIVSSGVDLARQVGLLLLFNVCFVLPLIAIVLTLWIAGDRADEVLLKLRNFLQRRWPALLACVMLLAGTFVILLGVTGIAGRAHGRFGRFFRGFGKLLHGK